MDTPRDDLYRSTPPPEVRADPDGDGERLTLHGHFSVFDEPTEIDSVWEGRFIERVAPGAFAKTLAEGGDRMRIMFNHGRSGPLENVLIARPDTLKETKRGGHYEATLFRGLPEWLYEGLRLGQYGASFRFRAVRDEWDDNPGPSDDNPEGLPERTVTEAGVSELGPVSWPAYVGADAALRSFTDIAHDLSTSPDAPPEEAPAGDAAANPTSTPPPGAPAGLTPAERQKAVRAYYLQERRP